MLVCYKVVSLFNWAPDSICSYKMPPTEPLVNSPSPIKTSIQPHRTFVKNIQLNPNKNAFDICPKNRCEIRQSRNRLPPMSEKIAGHYFDIHKAGDRFPSPCNPTSRQPRRSVLMRGSSRRKKRDRNTCGETQVPCEL